MSYYGSGGGSNNSSSWQSHNQKKQSSSSSSSNNSGSSGGSSFKGVSNDSNSSTQFGAGGTPNLTQSLIAQFAQAHNLGALPAALAGFGTWHSQNRMAGNSVVGQTPPSNNNSRSTSNGGGGKSDYVHHADTLQALFASPPPPPPPSSNSSSYNSGGGSQSRMQSSSVSKDPNFSLTGLSRPLAMNAMMSSSSSASSSGSGGSMMRGSSPPPRSSRFEGSTRGSSGGGNSGSSSSSSGGGGGGSGHHHSSSSSSSSSRYESSRNNNDDHRDRSSNDRSSYSSSSSSSNSNRYSSSSNNSNNHSNNQQQQQQQMSLAPPPPPQPAPSQQQTQNSLAAAVVNAAVANPLGLAPNPLLAQALLSQLAVAQQPSLVSTNSLLTAALSSLAAQQQAAVAPALTLAGLQAQVQAQQPQPPQQQQQQLQQPLPIPQQQQQPQKRRLSNDRRRGSRSRSPPPPQRRTRSRTPPRRSPPRRSRSPVAQRHTTLSSLDFRLGRNLSVTTTNAPGLSNRIVIRRSPERAPERVAGGPGGKQINIPRRRGDSRDDNGRDNDRHRSSSIKRKGSRSRSRSPRNSGRSVTATTKPSTNSTTTTSAVKRFATGAAPNTNKPGSNTTFNRTATTTSKPTPNVQSKEKEKEKEKESGSTNDSSKSSSTTAATTTTTPSTTTTTAAAATPQPTAQQQLVSKYGSRIPRYPLDQLAANVTRLKGRYPTLYVPSDFSNVRYQWHNALPMNRPLKFASSRCMFHIMSKDAHSIHGPNDAVYESSDADYRWTVKVMLLAMPSANEIQKRCLALAEDSGSKENRHEHPARVVEFLVGNRGKHEPMALGGPWSPSLDGPNPATNTQTLINTAVRTVRSLTGIDLSPCTQWFRILDIQYNRNENYRTVVNRTGTVVNGEDQTTKTSENGNDHESTTTSQETPLISLNDDRHIENTVIFLPNVWTLMPTSVEYEKIAAAYKDFIDNPPLVSTSKPNGTTNVAAKTTVETNNNDTNNKPVNPSPNPNPKPATPKPAANSSKPEETTTSEKSENVAVAPSEVEEKVKTPAAAEDDNNDSKSLKVESEMNGDGEMNGAANGITIDSLVQSVNKPEPTHYSKLDLKKMRVDDLRVELEARDLDTKGYKPQLLQRLREALQAEKDAEEPPGSETTTKIKQEEIDPEDVQIINDDMEVEKPPEDEEDEAAATNEQFNADYYGNGDEDDGDQQLEYDENAGEEGDGGEGGGDDYEVDLACDPNGLIEEADSTTTAVTSNTTDAVKTTTNTTTTAAKPAETKSKVIDLKARPKQTRYEREKIYKLPSTPHIIVHPSATAKSNKFNCHLASLSSLLDYSKDDSKECSFEVFLFAECFNEMLMRDQGFTIFKHLLGLSESQPSSSSNNSSTTTTSTTENGNNKRKTSDDTTANTTKKVRTTNEDSNDSESVANKSTTTTTTISLAKLKPKTVHTDLLLAFTYFDTNRTSHILEHDLEELLLRFGPLNLTRSKLRLLMKKLPTIKDGLINYRLLTDKTSPTTPLPVLYRLPPDDEIVHYALSFEAFLKRVQGFSGADQNNTIADSILVEINGTAIDVPNTLKKLEKAQSDLHLLDLKFKSSQDEIEHLKSSNRDTERQKQKLSDELSHVQNKLKYEQKSLKDLEEKYARLKSCMSKIKSSMNRSLDDISDVMKRNHPSEKEKSSSVSRSVERSVEKQIPASSTTSTSKPTTANSSLNNSQTESTTTKDKETPTTTIDAVVEKEVAKTTNGEVAEEDVTKS